MTKAMSEICSGHTAVKKQVSSSNVNSIQVEGNKCGFIIERTGRGKPPNVGINKMLLFITIILVINIKLLRRSRSMMDSNKTKRNSYRETFVAEITFE